MASELELSRLSAARKSQSQHSETSDTGEMSADTSQPSPALQPATIPDGPDEPGEPSRSSSTVGSQSHDAQPAPSSQSARTFADLPPVKKKVADHQPWKYRGYPAFCRWMASDDDFFVLRRFDSLSTRVALYQQDQVALLEQELGIQDRRCREALGDARNRVDDGGTFRSDLWKRRGQILEDLAGVLSRYQRFVLDHSKLKARRNASSVQIRNVLQWLKNTNGPIDRGEVAYLEQQDLIPVVPKETTPLRRFLDRIHLHKVVPWIRNKEINTSRYNSEDPELETTVYIRDTLVDKIVTCIIMLVGIGMLIGPLWWLQRLSSHEASLEALLGVITAFLILFAILISLLASPRPFEVLAATAAYGAVLMVYMQLGSPKGGVGNG